MGYLIPNLTHPGPLYTPYSSIAKKGLRNCSQCSVIVIVVYSTHYVAAKQCKRGTKGCNGSNDRNLGTNNDQI